MLLQSMPTPDINQLASIIRRTIRVVGAQPSHVTDPGSIVAAARLVGSRLNRAGIALQWIEGEHGAPMVVAGSGPVAVATYLDDSHPESGDGSQEPPELIENQVRGKGIERRAAAVCHLALLLSTPELAQAITLIVETDRNAGSRTLDAWLAENSTRFTAAAWEVSDLPLQAPTLVRSATGTLVVEVQLTASRRQVEPVYGTVLPDIGVAIAVLVSSIKSSDDEVRLEGFYDGIVSPNEAEFEALVQMGPGVSRWLTRIAGDERELSTAHMTLGMFCAPSVLVRSIDVSGNGAYLPHTATATIEFQLLPGQSVEQVLNAIEHHAGTTPFQATVQTLLVRPPVAADANFHPPVAVPSILIAPGPSPASLFQRHTAAGTGYALVGRATERDVTGMSVDSMVQSSVFLWNLIIALAGPRQ